MRLIVLTFILLLAVCAAAQSRRVGPGTPVAASSPTAADKTVKEMFDEANAYNKTKFAEFEQKKLPVSDALIQQTQRERKQLAARYAATVGKRTDLSAEETYYLGMLHWIADNLDGTRDSFSTYLTLTDLPTEKAQDARAILAVVYARQKQFPAAEKTLAEYLKNTPVRLSQSGQIEKEIAKGLFDNGDLAAAQPHAEGAYTAYKAIAGDISTREKGTDAVIDSGLFLFKIYQRQSAREKADALLDDMRKTGVGLGSSLLWYLAVDKQVTYEIETGRKPQALTLYESALASIGKEFSAKNVQNDLTDKLKRKGVHYKLLGEAAPELTEIAQFFPAEKLSLAEFKGKVVLLDFWATWCAPCIEAFPTMLEWNQDHASQGFAIVGVTRFYGTAEGFSVDNASEVDFVKRFAAAHKLTYEIAIAKDETNHRTYGAPVIPTAVLIDRKGVVRYIETGTSPYRLDELREMIEKLLAEK
jgi:thiol-disulfide isomerase/thioredoxin